jgi:hypothetical protein
VSRLAARRGFALPLVLAMVAVLALVMIAALSALSSLREETAATLESVEFDRTAASAEARLQYLLLTEPFGRKGLRVGGTRVPGISGRGGQSPEYFDYISQVIADGRPYRWREAEPTPAFLAQLQDEAGLLNFGDGDPFRLSRLLQQAGLSEQDADQLVSELLDYNAQPTPHEPIRRLAELYSLPSGRALISDKAWRYIDANAAVHRDSTNMNINTASRDVLKAWFDLTDAQLDQAIKDRDESDIGLASPFDIGVPGLADSSNYRMTGGRLRFIFTDPRTGLAYRSTLVLTPNNQERPIWVENAKTQKLPRAPETPDDLEDFPEIAPGAA